MATSASKKEKGQAEDRQALLTALTRRRLLAGTGQVALLAMLPAACAPIANAPWADGTFWDDGQGWTT